MTDLIIEELNAIPNLPEKLAEFRVSRHPAFANLRFAALADSSGCDSAYLSCSMLPEPVTGLDRLNVKRR